MPNGEYFQTFRDHSYVHHIDIDIEQNKMMSRLPVFTLPKNDSNEAGEDGLYIY